MDQNGLLLEVETSNNPKGSNEYHLFVKKTLQFLVPVSLLSFLLAYAYCFSFIYTYNFHFSTLVFPLFSHTLERKYMFLICNGILAFLAKSLSFNSSSNSPSITDFIHDESMKSTEVKPTFETPVIEKSVAFEETRLPVQYSTTISESVALECEKEEEEKEEEKESEEEEVYITNNGTRYAEDKLEQKAPECGQEGKFLTGSSLIIEDEDIYTADEQEDDYETEENASLLGASAAEEGNEINLNTEELNQKFEEFIRRMKEEIRIEAQQQLVVA